MEEFNVKQFESMWSNFADFITSKYIVGRGRISPFSRKDVFMVLTVLEHGGTWDPPGRIFNIKGPTFERLTLNSSASQVRSSISNLYSSLTTTTV